MEIEREFKGAECRHKYTLVGSGDSLALLPTKLHQKGDWIHTGWMNPSIHTGWMNSSGLRELAHWLLEQADDIERLRSEVPEWSRRWSEGDIAVVIGEGSEDMINHEYSVGDIVQLAEDDGTPTPGWRRVRDGAFLWVSLEDVAPLR